MSSIASRRNTRTTTEWIFLWTTAAQALVITGLELYILLSYLGWTTPRTYQVQSSYVIHVNFAIYVGGNIYQFILALDALRMKNSLQLWAICVLDVCLFVFSVMRYFQTERTIAGLRIAKSMGIYHIVDAKVDLWAKIQPVVLTSSVVVGACMLGVWVLVVLLQREFRWVIYRHISGSLEMSRRYIAYQVLLVLIRMEIYFLIGFIIIYNLVLVHFIEPEFGLTWAIIPVMWLQIAATIIFTKKENTWAAIGAITVRLAEMAYLASRVVVLSPGGSMSNTLLQDEMLLFAGVALAFATLACLNAMLCVVNFGKGLRPLLMNKSWKQTPHEFEPVHQHRWSSRIDLD